MRFSVVTATRRRNRFLGRTVALASAAADRDGLARRSSYFAVVVTDVKLGVQLEEVQASVQRVRVEHVPPHWTAPPVETYVP